VIFAIFLRLKREIHLLNSKVLIFFFLIVQFTYAQEFDIRKNSFFLPSSENTGKIFHLIGMSAAKLPEEIVESEELFRAPLFFYEIKVNLLADLSSSVSIESNIITFNFSGALGWNYQLGNFSFAPGVNLSYWFGRLKRQGFESQMSGFNLDPSLSAGYSFRKFSITIVSEALYRLSSSIKNGDITVNKVLGRFNGYSIGIFIEQPFWKDNVVVVGFRSLFLELYYPVWVAFSTFKHRFHVSEAVVGLVL
jgi:hypothetical protein